MNKRRIYRQGNSLVVSLPPAILDSLGLGQGDYVHICQDNIQRILLCPIVQLDGKWIPWPPRPAKPDDHSDPYFP